MPVYETAVDPAEVNAFIVEKLGPVIEGQNRYVVEAAIAIILINIAAPRRLGEEEVSAAVTALSAFLTLHLSELGEVH